MKKYLVKKEIVNISEPLVESYVNDELWNKNPKQKILSKDFAQARILSAVDTD